jgi:ribonuclease D
MIVDDLSKELLVPHTCAIDTETHGENALDFRKSRPVLFQYHSEEFGTYLVPLHDEVPIGVRQLLSNANIQKVAHYAPFDMRGLFFNYGVQFASVFCTKIALKIVDPNRQTYSSHSLKHVVKSMLGVELAKDQATTDWTQELTEDQVRYAENDVKYLLPVYNLLQEELVKQNQYERYAKACFWLPLRVMMDTDEYDYRGLYDY